MKDFALSKRYLTWKLFQTNIGLKYATLEDMDEADEFCVGKGYDGAADKLTRQELDDLHTLWKGRDACEDICIPCDFSIKHGSSQ